MQKFEYISTSPSKTLEIANTFAKFLSKGDVIILTGELGAGKTKFTEGILTNFNLENEISSPTFNIINEYSANSINIYHFDVYRLANTDEFYAIGGEEYFEKGICLIEWGEQIEDVLPKEYIKISFNKIENENTRILCFEPFGNKYLALLEKFFQTLSS